ncbi:hypothetical protein MTQ52_24240, partial [Escherichia coli]|nr:hypothetical protein [Escherichia coli]
WLKGRVRAKSCCAGIIAGQSGFNALKAQGKLFYHSNLRRKELLLRITCWVAVNGSRRKKPESMALMFSPVVIILPVKPVSEEKQSIKRMPERWPLVV